MDRVRCTIFLLLSFQAPYIWVWTVILTKFKSEILKSRQNSGDFPIGRFSFSNLRGRFLLAKNYIEKLLIHSFIWKLKACCIALFFTKIHYVSGHSWRRIRTRNSSSQHLQPSSLAWKRSKCLSLRCSIFFKCIMLVFRRKIQVNLFLFRNQPVGYTSLN